MNLDVLLIIRANIDAYPPTRNQANILAESGLRVGVIDLADTRRRGTELSSAVRRYQPHRQWHSKLEPPPSLLRRGFRAIRFRLAVARCVRRTAPSVAIGYDFLGAAHLPFGSPRTVKFCHFHELFIDETDMTRGSRRAMRKVCRHWPSVAGISFADSARAAAFSEALRPGVASETVMNCPRRLSDIPRPERPESLRERVGPGQVVVFLGSVGADQGVIETVRSMTFWPNDSHFVVIGPASDAMKAELAAALPEGIDPRRLHLLGPQPHREALGLAGTADIGVSLIQPNTKNWELSAGAINKRFEYAALGLAQVTSDLPGVRAIFDRPSLALFAPPCDTRAVGLAVRRLLDDRALRTAMGRRARQRHLEALNYEAQFGSMAKRIAELCQPVVVP